MPQLSLRLKGVVVKRFELEAGTCRIGRKADNDIQIDDPAVSSYHAQLQVKPSPYLEGHFEVTLEDLGSTNGTRVNLAQVERQMLKHSDVLSFGHHEFVFEDDGEHALDQTAILIPQD